MAKPDQKLESKQIGSGTKMFSHALIWSGIALLVLLIAGVLIARPAAKRIHAVTPNAPRSQLMVVHPVSLA